MSRRPRRPPVGPAWRAVLLVVAASGCRHPTPSAAPVAPRYVVGIPWQGADGAWFYPKEQAGYHETGLAVVVTRHPQHLTADSEAFDPQAPACAHQTLQLPAVLRVTNLDNGRQLLLRLNDRGPERQGRMLALTPAAAALLGAAAGPVRVAIDLDPGRSLALADGLAGSPHLAIAAAPVAAVAEESLAPPGSAVPGSGRPILSDRTTAAPRQAAEPDDLSPPVVRRTVPDPGTLWIDAGQFSRRDYADDVAAAAGGDVKAEGQGRGMTYQVRIGPFQNVPDADAALDRARRAGVTGARIIVA